VRLEERVTRNAITVRDAHEDDVPDLLTMWEELRVLGSRLERMIPHADADAVLGRLKLIADDPESRALVAVLDDRVVGMTVLTVTPYAPLFDQRAVHAHYLHVRDGYRKRGVGRALLSAAVSFADEIGAEHVITSVLPHLRDTQRFYARLGFGPMVVRRSVPVSVLRRRLSGATVPSLVDHLVARRRSLRRVRSTLASTVD
jgi:GNAT superfamily N-acetyltransferase